MNLRREEITEHESALGRVRVETLPVTHHDTRRSFTEFFNSPDGPTIRNVKVMTIKAPADGQEEVVIGGHWEQGIEVIYVTAGEISLLKLADVETGEEATYEHLGIGTKISLPPRVAHQLRFKEAASLVVMDEMAYSSTKLVIYPYNT